MATPDIADGAQPPARRSLRSYLAGAKYWLQRQLERRILLPLRGVRVDPTAEIANVRFRGRAVVEAHCRLMGSPRVEIGEGAHVGPHVHLQGDIVIGDRAWIGPRVTFWGRDHDFEPGIPIAQQGHRTEPIRVGADAEIGAGSILLRGVTVGAGARLGAGSICTKDVEPGAVVAGSPARSVAALRG